MGLFEEGFWQKRKPGLVFFYYTGLVPKILPVVPENKGLVEGFLPSKKLS